jgi:PAS domain S-box-containing protein
MQTTRAAQSQAEIMLVDDDAIIRQRLAQILRKEHKVRFAPPGPFVVEAVRSAPPDMILMDVMMPGINGYEIARQLKADPQTSEIPILFISGLDDIDSKTLAFTVGGVDFITKPFQEKEVLARVRTHLSIRQLTLQLKSELDERLRVEEILKASEEKYKLVFNAAGDAIYIHNDQGQILEVNSRTVERMGYTREELLALTVQQIDSADESKNASARMARVMQDGSLNFETVHQSKDGLLIPTEVNSRRISWEGKPAMMSICRDITERKQTQDALRKSENLYRKMTENSPLGMHFYNLNSQGELIFVGANAAASQLLGIDHAQFVGKNIIEAFPPLAQTEVPARYYDAAAKGIPWSTEQITYHDDNLISGAFEVRAFQTTPGNMVAVFADITERKQAESLLLRRNEEMAVLYETSLEMNSLTDVSALLKAIVRRACELLKIPAGALFLVRDDGKLEMVVNHQLPEKWIGTRIGVGEGLAGQVASTKKSLLVEDYGSWGGRLPSFNDTPARRSLGVPMMNHDEVIGVIMLVDKTNVGAFSEEEIRLASLFAGQAAIAVTKAQFAAQLEKSVAERTAELELAIRELESLSYTVSHDLRAPLRAIVGYSTIIKNDFGESLSPEMVRLLGLMGDNAQFMGKMVDGLLKFMRLNRKTLKIQSLEMDQMAKHAMDGLKSEQGRRLVEFTLHPMPPCQGDRELLQDVWHNLLSNALKFTGPRENAKIEAGALTEDQAQTVYYVKDNGVGFNMVYAGKLFKVFHRLHHTEQFEGIGMGLALSQRTITRHGGRIWIESKEGQGTTVYFTLG